MYASGLDPMSIALALSDVLAGKVPAIVPSPSPAKPIWCSVQLRRSLPMSRRRAGPFPDLRGTHGRSDRDRHYAPRSAPAIALNRLALTLGLG